MKQRLIFHKKLRISIRHKYLFSLLLLIIPLIIVPVIGVQYTSAMFKKTTFNLCKANLQQITGSMNFVIDDMIASSNLLAMDEDIHKVLEQDSAFTYQFEKTKLVLDSFRRVEAATLYSYNVDFALLDMNNNIYSDNTNEYRKPLEYEDISSQSFFQDIIDRKKTLYWITSPEDLSAAEEFPFHGGITLARLLFYSNTNHVSGMLLINISPTQNFKNILYSSTFEKYMDIFITDSAGNIIVSTVSDTTQYPPENMLTIISATQSSSLTFDRGSTLFLHQELSKVPWYIVGEIPYHTLMQDYIEYNRFQIGINIFFLVLTVVAIYLLSGYITKPILQIDSFVQEITKGDYSKRLYIKGSYEFEALSHTLNSMLDQTTLLMKDIESITREKERARTKILQAQLTPHFLLNALNGIKWLCNIEGAKSAEKMIVSLGFLLEHTLNTDKEFVPLSEEIECLKRYVNLQHMRYGYIFQFDTDIEDRAASYPVPIFLLQPLVENCIIHAFDGIDFIGRITVKAFINGNNLIIQVIDNGIGITKDWYTCIKEQDSREHIGIKNVLERINLYYNGNGNFNISPLESGGTLASITIPVSGLMEEELSNENSDC